MQWLLRILLLTCDAIETVESFSKIYWRSDARDETTGVQNRLLCPLYLVRQHVDAFFSRRFDERVGELRQQKQQMKEQ